jgi:hypothetical protein
LIDIPIPADKEYFKKKPPPRTFDSPRNYDAKVLMTFNS